MYAGFYFLQETNVLGFKFMHKYYTITALERDQYEVLWSRVQQY
jgi:hypothetical protein